jgi:hypothetical protein
VSASGVYELPARPSQGTVVLVTAVGDANGSLAAAAALACAGSEPDRAGLLIDLKEARRPRPTPIATAGARALEERVAAHLPEVAIASRGTICRLAVPPIADGGDASEALDPVAAALPLARESLAVLHLPPSLLQAVLGEPRVRPTAALLRADLRADRALTALVAGDLIDRRLRVKVLKQAPHWLAGRAALLGVPPAGLEAKGIFEHMLGTQPLA